MLEISIRFPRVALFTIVEPTYEESHRCSFPGRTGVLDDMVDIKFFGVPRGDERRVTVGVRGIQPETIQMDFLISEVNQRLNFVDVVTNISSDNKWALPAAVKLARWSLWIRNENVITVVESSWSCRALG